MSLSTHQQNRRCPSCGNLIVPIDASVCSICLLDNAILEAGDSAASDTTPWFELPSDLPHAGQVIGNYEILVEIARGGMGIVYRALQAGSKRVVALKMILPHQRSTPEAIARFRAESEIVTSLDHPNILPIFEIGELDGVPYFSMKLAERGSLTQYARDLKGRFRQIALFMRDAAGAIHYAHQRGVLHRDLKPANILIGQNNEPLVSDFGLARRLQQDDALTISRAVLGTPHYLSPEQARGENSRLTTSSDLYSLGAILYELLTGGPPFVGTDHLTVLRQVEQNPPKNPSELNPDVPRDLEIICLKCLAKDPKDRYRSAAAFADDLGRWLEDKSIVARPTSTAERIWRWVRRNPILASVSALLALAVTGIAIGSAMVSVRLNSALWHSYLAQARSTRLTGLAGQRFEALGALARASKIHPSPELRNEAAGALALPDLALERSWEAKANASSPLVFNNTLEQYAVAERPGIISIRRVTDQSEVRQIRYTGAEADAIIPFSKDDRFLGMIGQDDTWTFWDLSFEPAKKIFSCKGIPRGTRILGIRLDAAFSPQGPFVAVGQPDGGFTIYNLLTGSIEKRFAALGVASALIFDPTGARIAVALLHQKEVWILDTAAEKQPVVLRTQNEVISLTWNKSGEELASGEMHGTIGFFNPVTGNEAARIKGTDNTVSQLIYSASGDYLISTAFDGEIRIWDARNHLAINRLRDWGLVPSLRLAEKEDRLACSYNGTKAAILKLNLSPVWCLLHESKEQERGSFKGTLSINRDGSLLACGFTDAVRVYDIEHHTLVATIPIASDVNRQFNEIGVAFTNENERENLLVSSRKNGLSSWPVTRTGKTEIRMGPPQIIDQTQNWVMESLDKQGARIALLQPESGRIRVLQRDGPARVVEIAERPNILEAVISPDGRWLATTIYDPFQHNNISAQIWDLASRTVAERLPAAEGYGGLCGFSPSGEFLAIAGRPSILLSVPSWKHVLSIPQEGQAYVFSNDRRLLAATLQHQIKIYSFPEGNERLTLEAPQGRSTSFAQLAFSPDNSKLAVFYLEGSLQLWDLVQLRKGLRQIGLDWDGPATADRHPAQ
jgi:eukaryotic-like serine/threonine-protein kinase